MPHGATSTKARENGWDSGEGCVDDEGVRMLAREADLKLSPLSSQVSCEGVRPA